VLLVFLTPSLLRTSECECTILDSVRSVFYYPCSWKMYNSVYHFFLQLSILIGQLNETGCFRNCKPSSARKTHTKGVTKSKLQFSIQCLVLVGKKCRRFPLLKKQFKFVVPFCSEIQREHTSAVQSKTSSYLPSVLRIESDVTQPDG